MPRTHLVASLAVLGLRFHYKARFDGYYRGSFGSLQRPVSRASVTRITFLERVNVFL